MPEVFVWPALWKSSAFLNIGLNARNVWSWQCGWKLVGPTT